MTLTNTTFRRRSLIPLIQTEPSSPFIVYYVNIQIRLILQTARDLHIWEQALPDFLGFLAASHEAEELLGQEDLPSNSGVLLADVEQEMQQISSAFSLSEQQTEKLAERKIRLAQHRFAKDVLENCTYQCVFCGFEPRSLLTISSLLRASHSKPWAVSTPHERVDVQNGLAACPLHDAAFDQGYLTVSQELAIYRASLLQESAARDYRADIYFGQMLFHRLALSAQAKKPNDRYLLFHRENIFKG